MCGKRKKKGFKDLEVSSPSWMVVVVVVGVLLLKFERPGKIWFEGGRSIVEFWTE